MERIKLATRLKNRGFTQTVNLERISQWHRVDGYSVTIYTNHVHIFKGEALIGACSVPEEIEQLRVFLDAMPTTYAQNKAKQKMMKPAYDPATKPAKRCRNPRTPMEGQTTLEEDTVTIPIAAEEVSKIIREELELAEARILKRMRGD